jgi:hypothetical protein
VNCLALIPGQVPQDSFATQLLWDIGYIGLGLILIQLIVVFTLGHHGDMDGGGDGFAWSNFISLKSVAAMCLGVGFGGAAFGQNGFSIWVAVLGGICIGLFFAIVFIALMKGLHRLRSDGTARLGEAIGRRAKVYLRVPGNESAPGEIQVAFSGRFMNVPAFTRGPEIPTGADVLVISVHGENALDVERVVNE